MGTFWERVDPDHWSNNINFRNYYWNTSMRQVIKKIFHKEIIDPKLPVRACKLRKARVEILRVDGPKYDLNTAKIRTFVYRLRNLRRQHIENDITPSPLPSGSESDSDSSDEDAGRAAPRRWTLEEVKIMKKMFKPELSDPDQREPHREKFFITKDKLEAAGAKEVDIPRIRTWLRNNRSKRKARRERGDSSDSCSSDISTDSDGRDLSPYRIAPKRLKWTPEMIEIVKKNFAEELDNQLPIMVEKVEFHSVLLNALGHPDVTPQKLSSWLCNHRSKKERTGEAENRYHFRMYFSSMEMFGRLNNMGVEPLESSKSDEEDKNDSEPLSRKNIHSKKNGELVENKADENDPSLKKSSVEEGKSEGNNCRKQSDEQSSPEIKKRCSTRLQNKIKKGSNSST